MNNKNSSAKSKAKGIKSRNQTAAFEKLAPNLNEGHTLRRWAGKPKPATLSSVPCCHRLLLSVSVKLSTQRLGLQQSRENRTAFHKINEAGKHQNVDFIATLVKPTLD